MRKLIAFIQRKLHLHRHVYTDVSWTESSTITRFYASVHVCSCGKRRRVSHGLDYRAFVSNPLHDISPDVPMHGEL